MINKYIVSVLFFAILSFGAPTYLYAQSQGLSLSVTPALFEMSASPSQVWRSSVKVINNNKHELTVYANIVNFAPQGERGEGKFIPVFEEVTDGATLAEWVDLSSKAIVIAPEQSAQVPFTVAVPEDASPGGHFAAILIGTRPPDNDTSFEVKTSQIVTSLFFVRVAGDVIESGDVREFTTTKSFTDVPKASFLVRFENKGNVHLQPQGEIVITNMWGKERGVVPINHKTHFGNVLPESIRQFEFTWQGEQSFSDIGRYKAQLTLGYGEDSRKFSTRATYFWVVPVKAVLTVLGSLIALFLFVTWAIKAYIRRMLALSGVELNAYKRPLARDGDVLIKKGSTIQKPVRAGILDLQQRLKHTKAFLDTVKTLSTFIWAYRLFFGAVLVFVLVFVALWYFLSDVTKEQRDYEVIIENPDTDISISSEDILYERSREDSKQEISTENEGELDFSQEDKSSEMKEEATFEFIIVNSSDTPGLAAKLQKRLENQYTITDLQSDFGVSKDKTVIVYSRELQNEALALSKTLNGALLSALPDSESQSIITIYIGNDYRQE